ncbi:MAG: phage antirepressor protein [Microbispora sp.]|nr:phage antirepressor protein [Microbispora sp.]
MSGSLIPFEFPATGQRVRTVTIDGDPWFVAVDAATILGYANTRKAISDHVPAGHQKGNESFPLADLGLHPQTKLISEAGLYRLIMRSNTTLAEPFQDWVTADVLPAIRRTGSYSATARELTRRELAEMVIAEADRADQAERRAEIAEGTIRQIEGADGLTIRAFHKKYFSDVRERDFFEHLYAKGYLIDQRGKGAARPDGTVRDGSQHRHPSAKGKPYLYLHFGGVHGDRRREYTRVRPGQPELDFKAALIRDGLKANGNDDGLFAIEGGA